jgi:hypothetical protein
MQIQSMESSTGADQKIDISKLSPGVYFIRIGEETKSFIKQP